MKLKMNIFKLPDNISAKNDSKPTSLFSSRLAAAKAY